MVCPLAPLHGVWGDGYNESLWGHYSFAGFRRKPHWLLDVNALRTCLMQILKVRCWVLDLSPAHLKNKVGLVSPLSNFCCHIRGLMARLCLCLFTCVYGYADSSLLPAVCLSSFCEWGLLSGWGAQGFSLQWLLSLSPSLFFQVASLASVYRL